MTIMISTVITTAAAPPMPKDKNDNGDDEDDVWLATRSFYNSVIRIK